MTSVEFLGGMLMGFILGIGAAILYLRWKMKKQLGNLEEQMSALSDMGDELGNMDFEQEAQEAEE